MKNLYWFVTIIQRSDAREYEEFYLTHDVNVTYSIPCNGTAHAKTLNVLGLERTEKTMMFSVVTHETLQTLKKRLTLDMKIDLPNRGVAMAIPLSGMGGMQAMEYFTSGQLIEPDETEEKKMQSDYELIVAIYEKGYTDMVMDAAREAGARGGTTIKAKGTAAGAEKFFGLSLAVEKEVVFIVSGQEKKKDIMKAIMQKAGIET